MVCQQGDCPNPGVLSCSACGRLFCARHFCHPNSGNAVCLSCFRKNIRNQDTVGSWLFFILGGMFLIATFIWWNGGFQCLGLLALICFVWGATLLLLKGHIGVYGVFNKRHIPLFDRNEIRDEVKQ